MADDRLIAAARAVLDNVVYDNLGGLLQSRALDFSLQRLGEALPVDFKPCPAGHKGLAVINRETEYYTVGCLALDCKWRVFGNTKEEAIEQWNTRVES